LSVSAGSPTLILPVSALIFRGNNLQVGTVQDGNKAALKRVILGHDLGTETEIVSGLTADDSVIANPPDSLVSGETLRVVTPGPNSDGDDSSDSPE
jgi:hypothetical protein